MFSERRLLSLHHFPIPSMFPTSRPCVRQNSTRYLPTGAFSAVFRRCGARWCVFGVVWVWWCGCGGEVVSWCLWWRPPSASLLPAPLPDITEAATRRRRSPINGTEPIAPLQRRIFASPHHAGRATPQHRTTAPKHRRNSAGHSPPHTF